MRFIANLIVILAVPAIGFSTTIYVPDDYPTVQGAIDASVNNDTIVVRPGRYIENIWIDGKNITLMSESGPLTTILDGENNWGAVVNIKNGGSPIIDGFTITNGIGEEWY